MTGIRKIIEGVTTAEEVMRVTRRIGEELDMTQPSGELRSTSTSSSRR